MIIDSRAVLSEVACGGDQRVTLIRVVEVVRAISAFFQSVWDDATPANRGVIFADHQQTVLTRRVLSALHAGVPDKVAARQLNVSERTYGRYVAEAMAAIGANSRFHAGVRAAELGLLASTEE
jgi:DNA-binding NarL/FixJ family response regulator